MSNGSAVPRTARLIDRPDLFPIVGRKNGLRGIDDDALEFLTPDEASIESRGDIFYTRVANPFSMSRVYTNIIQFYVSYTRMRVYIHTYIHDCMYARDIPRLIRESRQQAFRTERGTLQGGGKEKKIEDIVAWQELTLYLLVVFDLGKIRVPDIDQTPDTEDAFRDAGLLKVRHTLRYSSRRCAEIHRCPPRVFSLVDES